MKEESNKRGHLNQEQPLGKEMAGEPLSTEGQIVIEEKQGKPNGEVTVVQYIRGNFLGKVRILLKCSRRC